MEKTEYQSRKTQMLAKWRKSTDISSENNIWTQILPNTDINFPIREPTTVIFQEIWVSRWMLLILREASPVKSEQAERVTYFFGSTQDEIMAYAYSLDSD